MQSVCEKSLLKYKTALKRESKVDTLDLSPYPSKEKAKPGFSSPVDKEHNYEFFAMFLLVEDILSDR